MVGYGLINLMLSFLILTCIFSLFSSGKSRNSTSLYIALFAAFISLFLNAIHYFVNDPSLRILLHEMKFILYIFTPTFSLIYLLNKYYDNKKKLKKIILALLSIVVVEALFFATDSLHHLIRKDIIVPEIDVPIIITDNNFGLYVLFVVQFSIFVFTTIFLIRQIKKYYKKENQLILIALTSFAFPLIGSPIFMITSGQLNSVYDWNFPIFALPVIGICLIEIFTNITERHPYSRGDVFDALPYPVILLNNTGLIKDMNNAANKFRIQVGSKIHETKTFSIFRKQSPITWHNNEIVIGNKTYKIHASFIDNDSSKKIKDIALILKDITKLTEYINILEYNNFHDLLTGVFNRKWFERNRNDLLSYRRYPMGLLMTDINKFKQINYDFGHEAGDKALIYFSKVMKESLPKKTFIMRFGGDEFFVIVPNTDDDEMNSILDDLNLRLSKSTITASFGYIIRDDDEINIEKDIKKADTLMYQNKQTQYDLDSD